MKFKNNYAKQNFSIDLDEDLEYYYNYNYWRLLICKWAYSPKKCCAKFLEKTEELGREVVYEQLGRNGLNG